MAFEYELPDVGEGVAEGEIVAWHVAPGDRVSEDEVLADVETDKAIVDLPSPVAGTIKQLHAEEGEVVEVGTVVVTIDVDGDTPEDEEVEDAVAAEPDAAAADAATSEPAVDGTDADGETTDADGETTDADGETPVASGRVFAPPNVRRLARELGVDITAVDGSGPSGRITEADVRSAAESGTGESEAGEEEKRKSALSKRSDSGDSERKSAVSKRSDSDGRKSAVTKRSDSQESGAASAADSTDREQTVAAPATRKLAEKHGVDLDEVPTDKTRDGEAFVEPEDIEAYVETREAVEATEAETAAKSEARPVRTEPYKGIRRTIGNQMQASSSTIPHATHHDTAVASQLVQSREKLKERAAEQGISLTYMPFVMKAIVAGLKQHPILNTELDEDDEEIRYKEYYNIGIAVATDAGLMVPVVEDVDEKGLLELASEINELIERARNREISREEMQGGTFTVTNFGAIGGEFATPIINYPETAILGIGELEQRPVVEGSGTDADVVARHTLPLSLSIDHRVIDGAEAAEFTNTVIEYLEEPSLLLLE
ncbi:MAG: dihydrolipoamide acetyltransferase family protein [Halovenus sp.]